MFLETPKPTLHPCFVFLRRLGIFLLALITLLFLGVVFCNLWICGSTHRDIFENVQDVPAHHVGLVLGTSKSLSPSTPNPHFTHRVEAASKLFKSGNVKHLLVSGDNRTPYYNEPRDLRASLIDQGVPAHSITCDFAGLRTLDSVIRAKEVFGQNKLVIISDDFHVPRAVYIAKAKGIDAVGLACSRVPRALSQRSRSREWLARVKALLDLYILDTAPRHFGDPVIIPLPRKAKSLSPGGAPPPNGDGDGDGDGDGTKAPKPPVADDLVQDPKPSDPTAKKPVVFESP